MFDKTQIFDFDIVIPVYQNYTGIVACLNSLANLQNKEISFRVVVCVDGANEDDTYEQLLQLTFPFKLFVLKHPDSERHGRNATRNLSLSCISAKFVLTLDSDMQASEGLLSEHLRCLTRNFPCISLGGVVYLGTNHNYWADYLNYRGKAKYQPDEELPFYYLAMGNAAFSAQVWLELGGQDPNMTHYGGGDTEFAYRMHQRFAWKTYYNPNAATIALAEKNLSTAMQQYYEFGKINLRYIRKKHPTFKQLFRFELWGNDTYMAAVIRLFLGMNWHTWLYPAVRFLPSNIRRIVIHLMVSSQIVRGFQTACPNKSNS